MDQVHRLLAERWHQRQQQRHPRSRRRRRLPERRRLLRLHGGRLPHLQLLHPDLDREAPHVLGEALPLHDDLDDLARLERPHDGHERVAPLQPGAAVLVPLIRDLPQLLLEGAALHAADPDLLLLCDPGQAAAHDLEAAVLLLQERPQEGPERAAPDVLRAAVLRLLLLQRLQAEQDGAALQAADLDRLLLLPLPQRPRPLLHGQAAHVREPADHALPQNDDATHLMNGLNEGQTRTLSGPGIIPNNTCRSRLSLRHYGASGPKEILNNDAPRHYGASSVLTFIQVSHFPSHLPQKVDLLQTSLHSDSVTQNSPQIQHQRNPQPATVQETAARARRVRRPLC